MGSRSRGRSGAAASMAAGSAAPPVERVAPDRKTGGFDDRLSADSPRGAAWPGWARVVVSLALIFHMAAVLAGALGVPPSSMLERTIADLFTPYYDLVDLGYSYRYLRRAAADAGRHGHARVWRGPAGGDGPPAGSRGGRPADAPPAAAGPGECAFHGRAGSQAADR